MANGLINLQTDLKSLKYSSMPLGSDKPYVTKDIGQAPSSQVGLEIQSRIDDTSRIAQMLVGKPGIKYLLHEAELQQVNVGQKIKKAQQGGKSLVGAVLQQAGSTLLNTVKIAGSTLAQVPVNGTGTHFLKGFRTDTYLQPSGPGNISAFASFFGAGGVEGAQYALRGEVVPGKHETELSSKNTKYSPHSTTEDQVTTNTKKAFSSTSNEDTPYIETSQAKASTPKSSIHSIDKAGIVGSGLPSSIDNIGKTYTTGSTYTGTDSISNTSSATVGSSIGVGTNTSKDGYIQSIPISTTGSYNKDSVSTKIDDFRKGSPNTYSYDYNSPIVHKEQRVSLGNQGKSRNRSSYMSIDPLMVDKLNALDVSDKLLNGVKEARDFAKFYFEIITPEGSKFLYFRAFIDSIDDGYNATWEGHKYVGRAENFYTYGGFDRDINVSFKIAAASRSEMKPLYKKMVYLASSTAPTYGASGLMRGTLARLTIGSYFAQIPGVITSVKYTLDNTMPWEIAMGNPDGGAGSTTDDDIQELPMMLNCSVSFKPIHDFAPQTGLHHFFTSPQPLNGSAPFFTDGEGDFEKAPITATIADKLAADNQAAAIAKAQQANLNAEAKAKAYNSDQAKVRRVVGPVDAYKVSKTGTVLGRETGGGI